MSSLISLLYCSGMGGILPLQQKQHISEIKSSLLCLKMMREVIQPFNQVFYEHQALRNVIPHDFDSNGCQVCSIKCLP